MTANTKRMGAMIAVIFQVWLNEGCTQTYLDIAATLRVELEKIDGFISIERFESLTEPGKYLSLSMWRDHDAVAAWRAHGDHGDAQARGKTELFADFRISVAEVVRDYTLADRRVGD